MDPQWIRIASTCQTVLITGRTGTGKTHLARELHGLSPRREARFVSVNLATLSENLIESELFGHEKGAFSGADFKRVGKLEWANGGTVFLDEIGELSPRLQTKLLEALNSHTISPVGSNREITLNIRVITATNRDLRKMVANGTFREDLFFRINAFELRLPDLKSSSERIPSLAERFARSAAERQNRPYLGFASGFSAELLAYPWPGNVRELKNCMEFAVAVSGSGLLDSSCLPSYVRQEPPSLAEEGELARFPTDYRQAKSYFERTYLQEILRRFEGRINLTARETGLSKVTLIEKIRRYQIDVKRIKYSAHLAATSQEKI